MRPSPSITGRPLSSIRLRRVADDKAREGVKLLFDRGAEIAAAVVRMDEGPEDDFVGAPREQSFLQRASYEGHCTWMVVSREEFMSDDFCIGGSNQLTFLLNVSA